MSLEMWERTGMIDLHYCTDMWTSYAARKHGWRTVVREGFRFTHHNAPRLDQHGRTIRDREVFRALVR